MGWSGGSEIASEIWSMVGNYVPKRNRKIVARRIIQLFEDHDCDTIEECEKLCEDAGYRFNEDTEEWEYD